MVAKVPKGFTIISKRDPKTGKVTVTPEGKRRRKLSEQRVAEEEKKEQATVVKQPRATTAATIERRIVTPQDDGTTITRATQTLRFLGRTPIVSEQSAPIVSREVTTFAPSQRTAVPETKSELARSAEELETLLFKGAKKIEERLPDDSPRKGEPAIQSFFRGTPRAVPTALRFTGSLIGESGRKPERIIVAGALGVVTGGAAGAIGAIGAKSAFAVKAAGVVGGAAFVGTSAAQVIAAPPGKAKFDVAAARTLEAIGFGVGARIGTRSIQPEARAISKLIKTSKVDSLTKFKIKEGITFTKTTARVDFSKATGRGLTTKQGLGIDKFRFKGKDVLLIKGLKTTKVKVFKGDKLINSFKVPTPKGVKPTTKVLSTQVRDIISTGGKRLVVRRTERSLKDISFKNKGKSTITETLKGRARTDELIRFTATPRRGAAVVSTVSGKKGVKFIQEKKPFIVISKKADVPKDITISLLGKRGVARGSIVDRRVITKQLSKTGATGTFKVETTTAFQKMFRFKKGELLTSGVLTKKIPKVKTKLPKSSTPTLTVKTPDVSVLSLIQDRPFLLAPLIFTPEQISKTDSTLRSITSVKTTPVVRSLSVLKTFGIVKTARALKTSTGLRTTPILKTTTSLKTTPILKTTTVLKTVTGRTNTAPVRTPVFTNIITPTIPGFPFFSSKRRVVKVKKKKKKVKLKSRRAPSVEAVFFGVRGKFPKLLTGTELRPLKL